MPVPDAWLGTIFTSFLFMLRNNQPPENYRFAYIVLDQKNNDRTRTNTNPYDTKPVLRVEVGARALRNQTGGGGEGGESEFSGLWVRSLECVCRALKTGNDRKKEKIPLQS